jgi:hypothetical protein
MKKLLLILLWPPAIYSGGEQSKPAHEPVPLVRQNATVNILAEIQNSNAEITPEDGKVKRTDIKKLFANEEVCSVTFINGQAAVCDVEGCGKPATNFWIDTEVGCKSCRCDKHK